MRLEEQAPTWRLLFFICQIVFEQQRLLERRDLAPPVTFAGPSGAEHARHRYSASWGSRPKLPTSAPPGRINGSGGVFVGSSGREP